MFNRFLPSLLLCQGHDTTNSAIGEQKVGRSDVGVTSFFSAAFTLFNIAKYKDVQKKCIAEIQTVIGSDLNAPVDMKYVSDNLDCNTETNHDFAEH